MGGPYLLVPASVRDGHSSNFGQLITFTEGREGRTCPFPKNAVCSCLSALFLSLGLPLPGSQGHPGHSGPTKSLLSSFWLILNKLWAGTPCCQLCAPSSWWTVWCCGPPGVASGGDCGKPDCTPSIHLALCWVTSRGSLGNDIIPRFLRDMPLQINFELHSPLLSALSNHWSFLVPWCSYLPQEFCRNCCHSLGTFWLAFPVLISLLFIFQTWIQMATQEICAS